MLHAFLILSLKRIRSRLGVSLLLTLTIALTTGVIACIPIFSDAVSRRIMQEELATRVRRQSQPAMSVRFYAMAHTGHPIGFDEAARYGEWIGNMLERELGLGVVSRYAELESRAYSVRPKPGDTRYTEKEMAYVHVVQVENIGAHMEVTAGEPFDDGASDSSALPVWVEQRLADKLAIQVGERYDMASSPLRDADIVPIRIAGFWQAKDPDAHYWYRDPPWHFSNALVTTRGAYIQHLYPVQPTLSSFAFWYYVLDERRMNLTDADQYVDALARIERDVMQRLPRGTMDNSPSDDLVRGSQRKKSLTTVLLGLSAPILAIMVYFIGTLSAMLVRFQEQEIAMFISRGSSRVQMLILTLLEGLIVLLAAMPAGIAISMALARMLGYSLTFLRFVPREPLAVYLASLDWRLVGACAAVVIVARLIPGWTAARKSIVVQEQGSARTRLALGTARLLLIGGLVATTAYAYRQLNAIGTMSLVSWQPNEASHDPLLLLAPSLFLLASPLVACELFAWLVRPLGWLGSLLNSAGAFLGCTELSREGARYRTPIYMLVLCLSAGVFYASLAKSADAWLIERREYEVGADLSFIPYYATDAEMLGMTPQDVREAFGSTAQLPISDYEQSPGVVEAMPVGDYRASMTVGKRTQRLRLMAIDRVKFPRVAYYREDYAARPLGELMNRLGSQMNGVLLPESLARELQLSEGDPVRITVEFMEETEAAFDLVLVGTFRYFPTMFEAEASVAVANLSYLQFETSALFDHSIWMRLAPEAVADEVLADLEQRKRVSSYNVHELRELVERDQSRLERVGIFGMLSVCFLTGALLSALGLFVHSAASMRGRSLRFAVLQALGLPREKLMLGVALEYGVALLYSVLVGLSLGIASAQLYVPFFQLTDKREVPVPPYLPLVDQERAIWMAIAMGLALASVVVGVFVRLVRTKVFETLRLGTRL